MPSLTPGDSNLGWGGPGHPYFPPLHQKAIICALWRNNGLQGEARIGIIEDNPEPKTKEITKK